MMTKAEFNYLRLKSTTKGMNIISYGSFVISAAFTIMLMFDSAATPIKQVLSVLMAIMLEAAKVYFFRFFGDQTANAERGGNLPGKYALIALTIALFVASTFGSIHYYMKTEAEKSSVDKQHDSSYASMNKDVESIDTQIEQLLTLAKAQQEKRYITASQATMSKVNELRKQKADALKNVSGYKAQGTSDSFFNSLGKFFGCDSESAKGVLYLFLAILLEFCGIASAFYGSYNKSKLFEMELAMLPDGDMSDVMRNRQLDRREAGFRMPPMPAPAMARHEESDHQYDDAPAPKKKNIGFVMEKPEPVRSQSQHEFPNRDDVLDALQSQLAELMAKEKARTEAARPKVPPAASKEEAFADAILNRVDELNQKLTQDEGHDGKVKPELKQKPVAEESEAVSEKAGISDYIRIMFSGLKSDGSFPGRRQVGHELGLSPSEYDAYHVRLKQAGLIRVDEVKRKTFPNCGMIEMIEMIAKG